MLPARARLRRREELRTTVRVGRRLSGSPSGLLVVHVARAAEERPGDPPRAGFIVARSVGTAVVRNLVRRRLRHLVAARLSDLPPGSQVVVRALPATATASSGELASALDSALRSVLDPARGAGLVSVLPPASPGAAAPC